MQQVLETNVWNTHNTQRHNILHFTTMNACILIFDIIIKYQSYTKYYINVILKTILIFFLNKKYVNFLCTINVLKPQFHNDFLYIEFIHRLKAGLCKHSIT